jgi:cytochrome c
LQKRGLKYNHNRDVANKYESNEANIKMLAAKVIKGGTGVWGEVPMAPHPNISQADAEQMVKYVFLLKNK